MWPDLSVSTDSNMAHNLQEQRYQYRHSIIRTSHTEDRYQGAALMDHDWKIQVGLAEDHIPGYIPDSDCIPGCIPDCTPEGQEDQAEDPTETALLDIAITMVHRKKPT
jgi:hypothetical protein